MVQVILRILFGGVWKTSWRTKAVALIATRLTPDYYLNSMKQMVEKETEAHKKVIGSSSIVGILLLPSLGELSLL